MTKSYDIPKKLVWEAFQRVKANRGGAGVDHESIVAFEKNLSANLYKVWNRMSAGSYFPPPVKSVPIPKKSGGVRVLGVPTVADRVAQTVVKLVMEPVLEPVFDEDSYGYRPGRSALDAVGVVRERCWRYNWVVEYDIKGLFDNIDHELLMRAVRKHCDTAWVLLYIERWLKAPMMAEDGTCTARDRGTPQGGVISPLLANLFLHYALDAWMRREMHGVKFCRYADDGVIHLSSEGLAKQMVLKLRERLAACKLELHPDKTRIVYCCDQKRRDTYPNIEFVFLGFTFRPRQSVDKQGQRYISFLPGVSRDALTAMRQKVRRWHLQLKSELDLGKIAKKINPVLRGWMNYYGRYYASALKPLWLHVNDALVRWMKRKCKRYKRHPRDAERSLRLSAARSPKMFVHWDKEVYSWSTR
jgi:RNA-directed DNA polymerase